MAENKWVTGVTLPPLIMEVENGSLQDDRFLYNRVIFLHFHDYERNGNSISGGVSKNNGVYPPNHPWLLTTY